jgi:hypothetical protein
MNVPTLAICRRWHLAIYAGIAWLVQEATWDSAHEPMKDKIRSYNKSGLASLNSGDF